MSEPLHDWSAFHIFLSDSAQTELFITEKLFKFVSELLKADEASKWFFIRYWEGGPHLRLRLLDVPDTSKIIIQDKLSKEASSYVSQTLLSKEAYYKNHTFDGLEVDQDKLPWFAEGSVVSIPYDQELERYGGQAAMPYNEDIFEVSSQLAVPIIKHSLSATTQRASIMISLFVVALVTISEKVNVAKVFVDQYVNFWSNYSSENKILATEYHKNKMPPPQLVMQIESIFLNAVNNKFESPLYKYWHTHLQSFKKNLVKLHQKHIFISPVQQKSTETQEEFDIAFQAIISSQLHMMANRLGIVPLNELMGALNVQACLEALVKPKTKERMGV